MMPQRMLLRIGVFTLALFSAAAVEVAHGQDQLTDSQFHVLNRIAPQRFEMGARSTEAFLVDHPDYSSDGDDRPIHPVVLTRPFYAAVNEVTRGQFATFVRETGYVTTAEKSGAGIVGWDPVDDEEHDRILRSFTCSKKFSWRSPGFHQTDFHPVVGVSHKDAIAYCKWLSKIENAKYRLPSEAEWECICRAGTQTSFSFGDQYRDVVQEHANLANVELENAFRDRAMVQWIVDPKTGTGDSFVHTAAVGSLAPNPWGLHDLHGNVWEWCADLYLDTFYDRFDRKVHRGVRNRAVDPLCDEAWNQSGQWRVIRGGSWCSSPIQARSGVRSYFEADDAACYIGFRVVREADEESVRVARRDYLASERARKEMTELSKEVFESRDGELEFRFACENVNEARLQSLSQVQDLVHVELAPPGKLTNELVAAVCNAKNLGGVILRSGGEGIEGRSFLPLKRHPKIRRVQITGTGDLGNDVFDALDEANGLVSLHLQGTKIDDAGLKRLVPSPKLERLWLSDTASKGHFLSRFAGAPLNGVAFSQLDDQGARLLSDFPTLREARLIGCRMTDAGLHALIQVRRLRDLSLAQCGELTDEGIAELSRLLFLRRLDVRGTRASSVTAASLGNLTRLESLQINGEFLSEQDLSQLAQISSLRELVIEESKEGDTRTWSSKAFGQYFRLVNLETLRLKVGDGDPDWISDLRKVPNLKELAFTSSRLTSEHLAALAEFPSLAKLSIGDWNRDPSPQVDALGLLQLCESAGLKQVTLVGYRDQISSDAIRSLEKRNPAIRWGNR